MITLCTHAIRRDGSSHASCFAFQALVTLRQEAEAEGRSLKMLNIDLLKPYSSHPAAARRA
jgi:hypothetical protein